MYSWNIINFNSYRTTTSYETVTVFSKELLRSKRKKVLRRDSSWRTGVTILTRVHWNHWNTRHDRSNARYILLYVNDELANWLVIVRLYITIFYTYIYNIHDRLFRTVAKIKKFLGKLISHSEKRKKQTHEILFQQYCSGMRSFNNNSQPCPAFI